MIQIKRSISDETRRSPSNKYNSYLETTVSFPVHLRKIPPQSILISREHRAEGKTISPEPRNPRIRSPNAADIGGPPRSRRNQHLLRLRDKLVHDGINPSSNRATTQLPLRTTGVERGRRNATGRRDRIENNPRAREPPSRGH